jgi:hypothetical protein
MPRGCEGCARSLHFASDDLALLNLDSVPSMCCHQSPSLPIANSVHHDLNDGRKASLDDTCGNQLAVGERDESDVACRRGTRLIVDSLQGNGNLHSVCAKTNKSLNAAGYHRLGSGRSPTRVEASLLAPVHGEGDATARGISGLPMSNASQPPFETCLHRDQIAVRRALAGSCQRGSARIGVHGRSPGTQLQTQT